MSARGLARNGEFGRYIAVAGVLGLCECLVARPDETEKRTHTLQPLAAFMQGLVGIVARRGKMAERLADFFGGDALHLGGQRRARIDAVTHTANSGTSRRASDAL